MLEFERTYYKNNKEKKYTYILDQLLGIEKYEKIEGNLKGEILERETIKRIIRENGSIYKVATDIIGLSKEKI